jgi:hypothetical protein
VEWSGVEWNGMEWSGMEWEGMVGYRTIWSAGLLHSQFYYKVLWIRLWVLSQDLQFVQNNSSELLKGYPLAFFLYVI